MNFYQEYRGLLQESHVHYPSLQATLDTISQNIPSPSPTAFYLSLLSLLSQPNCPESVPLLMHHVIPKVPFGVFSSTLQQLLQYGKQHLLILGQVLLCSKDMSHIGTLLDKVESQDRRRAIDVLILLIQQDEKKKRMSQAIKERLLASEGKQKLSWAMVLNRGLKYMEIQDLSEVIAWMWTTEEPDVQVHIYLALEGLIAQNRLSDDMIEDILRELLASCPNVYLDEKLAFSYGQCIVEVLLSLHSQNLYKAKNYVSPVLSICCELLQVENNKYHPFSRALFGKIMEHCINPSFWLDSPDPQDFTQILDAMQLEETKIHPFEKCVSQMRFLLTQRFQFQLKYSFEILGDFFNQLEPQIFPKVQLLIEEFLSLRQDKKTPKSLFQKCFQILIKRIHPEHILKLAPINLNIDFNDPQFEDNSNLWLIPYFSRHLKATPLSFFVNHMLPLLQTMSQPVNSQVVSGVFAHLSAMIWDLLPYCHALDINPGDILNSLQSIQLTPSILKFYEQISLYSITHHTFEDELKAFAEKLIPYLVKNIGTYKPHVLRCLRAWSLRANPSYLERVINRNVEKLLKNEGNWLVNCEVLIEVLSGATLSIQLWSKVKQLIILCFNKKEDKLASKLCLKCIPKLHVSYLKEFYEILDSQKNSKVGVKPLRLQIIERVYEHDKTQIQNFLPEIIASIRYTNQKARKTGKSLLLKIADHEGAEVTLQAVMAGLGASSSLIKADTIEASALLMGLLSPQFMDEILNIYLLLFNEKNKEIFRSLLKFLKKHIKLNSKEQITPQLSNVLNALLNTDSKSKDACIAQVKHFLEKCMRKVGKETLLQLVPAEHKKLVQYTDKSIKQLKKKKQQEKLKRLKYKQQEQETTQTQDQPQQEIQNLLLKFDSEQEVFHFQEQPKRKQVQVQQEQETFQDIAFVEGKMIVREQQQELGKKRKRDQLQQFSNFREEDIFDTKQSKPERKVKQLRSVHMVKESGSSFKAKNASGDVKIQGRPDPYAFIQLNPKALNKRFSKRSEKSFAQVSEGPLKGLKKKVKN